MPKLTPELIRALGRKRGEMNIPVLELAKQTGVSRYTLDKILRGEAVIIQAGTLNKLNRWLYQQV